MARIIGTVGDVSFLQRGGKNRRNRRNRRSEAARITLNGYSTDSPQSVAKALMKNLSFYWKPVYDIKKLQSPNGVRTTAGPYGYSKSGITPYILYDNISNLIKNGTAKPGNAMPTIKVNSQGVDTYFPLTPKLPLANVTGLKLGIGPYAQPQPENDYYPPSSLFNHRWSPNVPSELDLTTQSPTTFNQTY